MCVPWQPSARMSRSLRDGVRWLVWGRDRSRIRATWRIALGFAVVLGVLIGGNSLLGRVSVPAVLVNGPVALVVLLAIGAYLLVASRLLDERPVRAYGFEFDRRWWLDLLAAVVAGCLFQATFTGLTLALDAGRVVGTLSAGVAAGRGTGALLVAVVATVLAFAALALWEELLFRAVFILNASEGLTARGVAPRRAVWLACLVSVLLFGPAHALVAARGATPLFAAGQAMAAAVYFALGYVLTGSLAFPVGLHFSTNLWVASVFGQAGSGFPALVWLERSLQAGPTELVLVVVPMLVVIGCLVGWMRLTRGRVSLGNASDRLTAGRSDRRPVDAD